jgi:GDP-4-dehydro-6-deoxy-D-mannose reductase
MKILVTGIAGFVGSHLADLIDNVAPEAELYGIVQDSPEITKQPNLIHLKNKNNLSLHLVEMTESQAVVELLSELKPDYIFHLAARSHVGPSFANPAETLDNNQTIALNLFEAVKNLARNSNYTPKILNTGSSDQYGYVNPEELPVRENQPFRPGNPYAVSKITQEMLGYQYARSFGLAIYNTRAFNQLGPRQNPALATAAFARQIAQAEVEYERGNSELIMKVGNLDSSRDYSDVRDMVRAYWLVIDSGKCQPATPYNICSGQDYKISVVLKMLLELARCKIIVEQDPTRQRPSDIPAIRGDCTLFRSVTGWEPEIPLEQSLEDLLNYWREEVRKS